MYTLNIMFNPVSTYRIQFQKGFNFKQFSSIIPYLQSLGIKTVYASPIFAATPGSMHGYDVTDAQTINPEIGTIEELRTISKQLKELGIGWLQDIVPNHMAFDKHNNWLMDVLEKGRHSSCADFFDIDWDSPVHDGKLMVPFLGVNADEAIKQGDLKLQYDAGKVHLAYADQLYPINAESYGLLLKKTGEEVKVLREGHQKLFDDIFEGGFIDRLNKDKKLIKKIVDGQFYTLCHWQETDKQINYRRFFTVNGLICLNIQHEHVFDKYHELIKQFIDEGIFQGLRVDHIDGLYNPTTYQERLRKLAGDDVYIVVEKILEQGESFPSNWPIQGNTGYDFLGSVNNLFTQRDSEKAFDKLYQQFAPDTPKGQAAILQKKNLILTQSMRGELNNLYRLFSDLQLAPAETIEAITPAAIKTAICELLVHCPVYRFYGNKLPLESGEAVRLRDLFVAIRRDKIELTPAIDLFEDILLIRPANENAVYNERALRFYQRLMQFTGPLMAKGVEDTLMYTDAHFVGHNEVGDSPEAFGTSAEAFHSQMQLRQQNWPLGMNATSTHDTKRGEDVRARLNVLSDIPDEWDEIVRTWKKQNKDLITAAGPKPDDEYFIYQTLAGAHPMPGQEDDFETRLKEYLTKALREGKQHSSWARPNQRYERSENKFITALLDPKKAFQKSFAPFLERIADYGIINSLAQVLLKYTTPGMPDLYQGCELWDLSLVDPDNRRPVDFEKRQQMLAETGKPNWQKLWETRYEGQIKLTLTQLLLQERGQNAGLFLSGDYIPLKVKGAYKKNILAFARRAGQEYYIVAIPLGMASLAKKHANPLKFDWDTTRIVVPFEAPLQLKNLLTGEESYREDRLHINDLFEDLPIAFIKLSAPYAKRASGVLMHVSSLPSPFGIGDLGPKAYQFTDLLFEGRQRYWQMLPVNPVVKENGFSPYSSTSAFAGNTMLISPELLQEMGWLTPDDTGSTKFSDEKVDFEKVADFKHRLFEIAYANFKKEKSTRSYEQFEEYKSAQAYWLDDYALYVALKYGHSGKAWYHWLEGYKKRDKRALKVFTHDNAEAIDREKWLQFVFTQQWSALRDHCSRRNIRLLGDMPFYVSHDSADVWANPQLFNLDKNGEMLGIAGVPPDYFSADGQLWNMPVYNWAELKKSGYQWWVSRIKKNLEYFDLIRLDHFRAFASYWDVPAGSPTAATGTWKTGPGADFFETLQREIGHLPFVAEDLGEITRDVYQLRDQFGLPGTKVLQFAFDKLMPASPHIPHNYTPNHVAYTGTHDNNTVVGWFKDDIDEKAQKRIEQYTQQKTGGKNVANLLTRLLQASAADVAIIPIQDIIGLDGDSRMNTPSKSEGNWAWRMDEKYLRAKTFAFLRDLAAFYNR